MEFQVKNTNELFEALKEKGEKKTFAYIRKLLKQGNY